MAEKVRQLGVQLKIGDGGGPETFAAIPQLFSIGGIAFENEVIDFVAHDSVGRFKEKLATFLDAGQLEFQGYWDPNDTTHGDLLTLVQSGAENNFQLVFPNYATTATYEFAAVVQRFGPDTAEAEGEVQTFTGVLNISGAVTETLA